MLPKLPCEKPPSTKQSGNKDRKCLRTLRTVKQNKPVTNKWQIWYDPTPMDMLSSQVTETESRKGVTRSRGAEMRDPCLVGTVSIVWEERYLSSVAQHVNVLNTPELHDEMLKRVNLMLCVFSPPFFFFQKRGERFKMLSLG